MPSLLLISILGGVFAVWFEMTVGCFGGSLQKGVGRFYQKEGREQAKSGSRSMRTDLQRLVATLGSEVEEHDQVAEQHEAGEHGDLRKGSAFALGLHGSEFGAGGGIERFDLGLIKAGCLTEDAWLGGSFDL